MYTENQIQIFVLISSIFIGIFVLTTVFFIVRLKLKDTLLKKSENKLKEYSENLEEMVADRTKQLSESEESYKQLYKLNEGIVENSPAGIIRLDAKLRISYENPEMKRILGVPPGEKSKATGMDIRELSSIKNAGLSSIFNNLLEDKEIANERLFISVYGKETYVTLKGVPIFENDKFAGAVLLVNDITERKQAEEVIMKSEEQYKNLSNQFEAILDHIPGSIFYKDKKNNFITVNKYIADAHKLTKAEMKNKSCYELYPGKDAKAYFEDDLKVIKSGKAQLNIEEPWKTEIGSKWVSTSKIPFVDAEGKIIGVIGISFDITERKRAEQTQSVLYNIADAVNTVDNLHELFINIREYLGNVIDTTNFYVALYDEKTDYISLPFDVDEKDDFETFPAGKTLTSLVIKTGKPLFANKQLQDKLTKQGKIDIIGTPSEIWLGVPLKVENKVIGVIAVQSYDDPNLYTEKDIKILTFISEEIALAINRKQAEEQMKRDLKEKELLLREIHHRVKNNLQVISSLLQLQQNEITTKEDAIKGFAASQDRILAMAKAYELLLGSEYMSEVSVGKYIESLAEQLKYNYDIHHKVKISYSLDELTISIEILDRLGLVLNEIITNAIKYAFEGREVGNIHIELKETEKHVVIKISDDGIGMPKNIDINDPDTLGLSIVDMITQQLQGTLSLDRKNGTSFILEIPKKIVE